jgi:RNA polymerase sigma-70 factor, ECF subfamily
MRSQDPYTSRMQEMFERSLQFRTTEAEDEELQTWLEASAERWWEEQERKEQEQKEDEERHWLESISSDWGEIAGESTYPLTDQEKEAFITTISLHSHLFYKIAFQIVGNYIQAQDAMQEGLYKAYKAMRSYRSDIREKLKLKNWICKIVKNASIDQRAKLLAHSHISTEIVKEFHLMVKGSDLEQPLRYTERKELIRALQSAIVALPRTKRDIVILRYVYGCKDAEIAFSLNRPLGTIKKALHDSHVILRIFLEKQGIGKDDIGILLDTQSDTWLRQLCVPE